MTEELAKLQKQRKRAEAKKLAERSLDHVRERGSDLSRNVEREATEIQHRGAAKKVFQRD